MSSALSCEMEYLFILYNLDIYQECSDEEFRCDNDMCISTDSVCDGRNDCVDHSDEKNCGQLIII